jgi:hypothetical protein
MNLMRQQRLRDLIFCEDCDIEVPVDVAVNPTAK